MFLARFGAFILAATFGWAALAKLLRFSEWRAALRAYRFSQPLERVAVKAVPIAEAAIATLLLARFTRVASVASIALLAAFSLVLYRAARQRGSRVPCGCFGRTRERDARIALARNAALMVVSAWLLGRGDDFAPWPPAPQGDEWVAAALTLLASALAAWAAATFASAAAQGRAR